MNGWLPPEDGDLFAVGIDCLARSRTIITIIHFYYTRDLALSIFQILFLQPSVKKLWREIKRPLSP